VDNVLKDPPPRVQFLKFGDYSLDFRLLVWSSQPRRHAEIRSDINYRIERLFRERDIKLPHSTQEFVLRGVESLAREPDLLANDKTSAKDSDHGNPNPATSND
jgi:small-conductance mechanosensitive channel